MRATRQYRYVWHTRMRGRVANTCAESGGEETILPTVREYVSASHDISRSPVPMSGAGTSIPGPMAAFKPDMSSCALTLLKVKSTSLNNTYET